MDGLEGNRIGIDMAPNIHETERTDTFADDWHGPLTRNGTELLDQGVASSRDLADDLARPSERLVGMAIRHELTDEGEIR